MRTQSICLALAVVLVCPIASAQWIGMNGPYGSAVLCLAINDTTLFAGTLDGHVWSTVRGTRWTSVDSGLARTAILALQTSNTNLFAGTIDSGPFLSTDNGTTWSSVNIGASSNRVQAFAVSGTNLFAGTYGGVYLSTNSGTDWVARNVGLTDTLVSALAASDTNLFAGTAFGSVFRSTDNGASWTGGQIGGSYVADIAVSGENVFAATSRGKNPMGHNGLFRSTNNGASWEELTPLAPVGYLAVFGSNIFVGGVWNTMAPGVYLSTNNGVSWETCGLMDTVITSLVVSDTILLAGTDSAGVWRRPLSAMITTVRPPVTELPAQFSLEQNYPNPFNPTTTIKYELPNSSEIRLSVYDMLGREVSVLVNERKNAGLYEVKFDAGRLASGVYFYRIQAGDFTQTKRLSLLK